jgi:hypothetical protein
VPQATRLILPPFTNDFIALLKDSSLVSVRTMMELTGAYNRLATETSDYFGTGQVIAFSLPSTWSSLCTPCSFNGGTARQGTFKPAIAIRSGMASRGLKQPHT